MKNLKNRGQSTVEYVLLLAVVAIIAVNLLKSDALNELIGDSGVLMNLQANKIQYSYRHAFVNGEKIQEEADEVPKGPDSVRLSYQQDQAGDSRIFLSTGKYGQ